MRADWIVSGLSQAILCTDSEVNICYLNPAAEQLLAVKSSDVCGKPVSEALGLKDEAGGMLTAASLKDLCSQGHEARLRLLADGGAPEAELAAGVSPVHDGAGEQVGYSLMLASHTLSNLDNAGAVSHLDPLTSLEGRKEFEHRIDNLVNDAATSSRTHALLYIDIDQFKLINDTSGHGAGDNLIKVVGECIQDELFTGDLLYRLGGDEFGVLLSNVDAFEARAIATRLVKAVKRINFNWGNISHRVSVSIGVVLIDQYSLERQTVMSQADVAMYSAKDNGRDRVHIYDVQDKNLSRLHDEMDWVHRINEALSNDDFCLVREHIVSLGDDTSALSYSELLLRMKYKGELLSPGQFMPAAERFGLMPQVDRWVVNAAIAYLRANPQLTPGENMFSVNISGQSLCQEAFLEFVYRKLRRGHVDPGLICFEITETVAITNYSVVTRFIERVHELGGQFALDDFGTGMSSFGYLQELPVDFVKIDGLFVHDMDTNPVHEAMVRSINDISHVLGKRTIAEFVERESVQDKLRDLGVDFSQGYLHGRPAPLLDGRAQANS